MQEGFFYFNGALDCQNQFRNAQDIQEIYRSESIIILENIHGIEKIERFILDHFKAKKKVIIIGNSFSVKGIPEYEVTPLVSYPFSKHKNEIDLIAQKILAQDIYIRYKLKDYRLLTQIIGLLVSTNNFISVREIHNILKERKINISQITLIEYMKFILNSKIVKKLLRYDFKNDSTSTGKARYIFADTHIRASLSGGSLPSVITSENFIYQKLVNMGYTVYT
jgi:predicted AAA+ superfamily ATPase